MNTKTNLLFAAVILGSFAVAQKLQAAENKPASSPLECTAWHSEKSFTIGLTQWPSPATLEQAESL